jgi:aryl-alcohol dehydrogenase-like predicted oxidoreductase
MTNPAADFAHTTLGSTGLTVHRLGLSASYRPGKEAIYRAAEAGVNLFFSYGFDGQMISVLRDLFGSKRESCILATGAYNYIWGHANLRRTLEKRLRQFRTDYIDLFMFLGVTKEKQFPPAVREELQKLREEERVRFVGVSTHDRKFAGRLAAEGALDVFMIRYNAAHRGAEEDIFPHLERHNPGVVSYTATRWTRLLRRSRNWPREKPLPDAGMIYRFVLSHPSVHACLTAPRNMRQLDENLSALEQGPLSGEEMEFMKEFGDRVYESAGWFW